MALYRVISESGAYLARDPTIVRLELGADTAAAKAYSVRAAVSELLPEGTEFSMPADYIPGPHLQALDEEARTAMRAYLRTNPGSMNPTSLLPLTGDFERVMQQQMARLLEASAPLTPNDEVATLRAENASMSDQLAALSEQVAQLVAQRAPPARRTP